MRKLTIGILGLASGFPLSSFACPDFLNTEMRKLASSAVINFCEAYGDNPLLIVNTASLCGYTSQFDGLEALYQRYRDQGLLILGIPTGDFGGQEYEDSERTAKVCHANYGVTFPVFRRGCVRCEEPQPLLKLAVSQSGVAPKWNFYKYLFNPRSGEATAFPSKTTRTK